MTKTNETHRFTVITDYGHGPSHEFVIAGTADESRIRAVLLMGQRQRISGLLAAANVQRKRGEDVVWEMVQRGEVVIGPDSTIRLVDMANRKPGRPPRAARPSSERIEIRITAAERKAWERAAGETTLSEWLRSLANAASNAPST